MSKPTVSAAGGAMPAESREAYALARLSVIRISLERTFDEMRDILDAADAPPEATPERRSLLDVDEALNQAHNLIIAASNLASSDDPYLGGLHAVIIAAEEKLDAGRRLLAASRGQDREAVHV